MSDALATVLMVVAVAVLALTVLVWVRPLTRPGSEIRRGSAESPASDGATPTAASPVTAGPLARGFGYLFSPPDLTRRQTSVGGRFEQALRRIDSVDPYVNHRRIGLALLKSETDEPRETEND